MSSVFKMPYLLIPPPLPPLLLLKPPPPPPVDLVAEPELEELLLKLELLPEDLMLMRIVI